MPAGKAPILTRQHLAWGDIEMKVGKFWYVVELKRFHDMPYARFEGRFDAQMARAQAMPEEGPQRVLLIQGPLLPFNAELALPQRPGLRASIVERSIMEVALPTGAGRQIPVLRARDTQATADMLILLYGMAASAAAAATPEAGQPAPVLNTTYKPGTKSGAHASKKEMWTRCLYSLRGVSFESANSLAATFCDAAALNMYITRKSSATKAERDLADIELKPGRRVGPSLAKKLVKCFG